MQTYIETIICTFNEKNIGAIINTHDSNHNTHDSNHNTTLKKRFKRLNIANTLEP